ncbi:unnamed protein product [Linum trigynum]|uniref:Uncharacterized protein n=1 Tax=Linum trigynum TaxID=586398 RepID=A0AAV2CFB8_9ROSI
MLLSPQSGGRLGRTVVDTGVVNGRSGKKSRWAFLPELKRAKGEAIDLIRFWPLHNAYAISATINLTTVVGVNSRSSSF